MYIQSKQNNYYNSRENKAKKKKFQEKNGKDKKLTKNNETKNSIISMLTGNNDNIIEDSNIKDNFEESISELDRLIGLKEVKELVKDYTAYVRIQNLRRRYGLKNRKIVKHMVFKGNPGTGKTTVARILAKIFNNIGFLDKGHFIEVERADLVGEYIGHTAQQTKKKIKEALGGVLFIDEAYSLARGGERDFGKESIDALVKGMEDYKDNLIIILAGYSNEMDYFLETNPGLRSRIALHLDFPDYSVDELINIAKLMVEEREYILSEGGEKYLYRVIARLKATNTKNFGNARTVRNLIEKSIRNQARRIISKKIISRVDLITIKHHDIPSELKNQSVRIKNSNA